MTGVDRGWSLGKYIYVDKEDIDRHTRRCVASDWTRLLG